MSRFIPDAGDIVWIQFSPSVGREQSGHRPAAVLTQKHYNQRSGLLFCVPLTSKVKGYPFEVPVGSGDDRGVALVDHARSIDWEGRKVRPKGKLASEELAAIRERLAILTGME